MDEFLIIQKFREKDEKVIEVFIDKYSHLIYGVLKKLLIKERVKHDIEDIFYTVIMKLWINIDCYDENKGKFINYIISIARYTAIDYLRKCSREEALELKEEVLYEEDNKEGIFKIIEKEELLELLVELKDKDKDIFIRRYLLQEDVDKIAKDLGETEPYIYTRLSRGRNKIKNRIEVI